MSRDAQQPHGADRPRGAFDIPDDELVSSSRPGSHGLFDPTGEVQAGEGQTSADPFDLPTLEQSAVKAPRRDTGRVLGAPILGSGPEIARSPRREPTGRHEALRQAPFAPTAAAPAVNPSALERLIDAVQRWRSPLGLGLAALITVGVVVVYERSTGSDEIATDASGGEGRSALASATDFDETTDEFAIESTPQQDVDSAVDEITPSTAETDPGGESGNGPNTGSSTTTGPASPTTAATPDDPATPASPTTSATPSSAGSPAPTTRPTTATDQQTSSPPSSAPASVPTTSTPPTSASPLASTTTAAPDPPAPVRTEAEAAAVLGGAVVAAERMGFSGTGYVTGLDSTGDGVSFTVTSAGGETPFAIGYSAGPVDGAPALRTASILVDGDRKTSAQMDETPTFDDWTIVAGTLDLPAGQSTITIEVQAGESGQINIDYIEVG